MGTHGPTLRQLLAFLGSENTHHLDAAIQSLLVRTWRRELSFAAGIFVDRTLFQSSSSQSSCPPPSLLTRPSQHLTISRISPRRRPLRRTLSPSTPRRGAYAASLVSGGAVDRETKIVLANGMHFKATWAQSTRRTPSAITSTAPTAGPCGCRSCRTLPCSTLRASTPLAWGKVIQCFYRMVGRECVTI